MSDGENILDNEFNNEINNESEPDDATSGGEPTPPKYVYILPNLFTSASLLAGFWSLILSSQNRFEMAALAVVIAAFFDGMDGKVARLTHTASEFGIQYDSLADLVSFGVAPGFLAWCWHLQEFGRFGACIAFLFVACAALRLARFNVSTATTPKKFFIGIPSPAAGCLIALFVIFCFGNDNFPNGFESVTLLILTFVSGLLMVSRIRYFSFKEYTFLKKHPFRWLVLFIVIMALIMSSPWNFCFIFVAIYALSGMIYSYVLTRREKRKIIFM